MKYLEELLKKFKDGNISVEKIMEELKTLPYKEMDFARIDHHRTLRNSFPEVIYCPGKEDFHIVDILKELGSKNNIVLATRASAETAAYVAKNIPEAVYHEKSRIISLGKFPEKLSENYVLIITGGTADLSVAEEALITLKAAGVKTELMADCGVAGSHRVFKEFEKISNASAIIAVAGMEGALASFIGGLANCPVIGVPTSVGYGASFGGITALLGMLNSCASNVSVVNIDNGFGAARIASLIAKKK